MSAWLDREFLMELEKKKRFSISSNRTRPHRKFIKLWVHIFREKTQKAKTHLELKLASVVPHN